MPAVFISYRRSDSSDITGRIFDRLVGHFGSKPVKVVRDVDSIPVGEDFRDVLREKIQECDVVLVVIGPNWTSLKDSKGVRRLDDAADTVRIEIEQALELKKKVIPVCVTHATMPGEDDLPVAIKKLAFRNGVQVRPDPDFNNDIKRLTEALDKIFKDKQIAEAKPPTLPPPQRHLHAPEPPPPPFTDMRRSPGSHGSHPGIPQGPPVSAQAVSAKPVEAVPVTPQPRGDSTSGNWPRPGNVNPSLQHPSTFNQPAVRPLQTDKPRLSSSLFTSATGVALLLTGLVSLCMCGGMFVYFCMSIAGRSYESELRADIKSHPAIVEHLGEIESVAWEFAATGLPRAPNGELSDLFKVKGSKGSAEVIGHTDSVTSNKVGDILRLPDGREISLHESYMPADPGKVLEELGLDRK